MITYLIFWFVLTVQHILCKLVRKKSWVKKIDEIYKEYSDYYD
jgi:hypothetical protein